MLLQWPPPSGLYGGVGVPEVPLPVPGREPAAVPLDLHERWHQEKDWAWGVRQVSDFSKVTWPGCGAFLLNARQAAVVRLLYEAFMDGNPEVRESVLLATARKAGSDADRLRDVFRHNPAWGTLVVPGPAGGDVPVALAARG